MALPHQSIATINSPEFINLQPLDINPFMSSCEIKVLYVGENRNRSYITKEVAIQMSKTLRGAPIVGYYKEDKQDFADHGEQMIWDDEGIHFNVLTRPYGFVAPDAKVWFQKFEDTDEFGNTTERQYLMTTGYLWTKQFEQAKEILEEGKPQSMELDEDTLEGHWATDIKRDLEFFIINDAIFTKLCILGDDVEPCFEGASITKPEISANFSYDIDEKFKTTLFSMMNELKDALKGGNNNMDKATNAVELEQQEAKNLEETSSSIEQPTESFEQEETNEEKVSESFEQEEVQEEEEVSESFAQEEEEDKEDDSSAEDEEKEEDDEDKKDYSLLEQQYTELKDQYEALKAENEELVAFKTNIENEQKDALINDFFMLSEEDKKDVIENKAKYSLAEIKAKLAVICYEKKVNFSSENMTEIDNNKEEETTETENVITYTFNDDSNLPDWVKAVKDTEENNN